jgi:hypothetical protein
MECTLDAIAHSQKGGCSRLLAGILVTQIAYRGPPALGLRDGREPFAVE